MASALRKPAQSQYASLGQQDFSYDPGIRQQMQKGSNDVWKSQPRIPGGKRTIYVALACILVPMVGLSCLLIGLVYAYQVEKNQTLNTPLALSQSYDTDDSAYYVHINSTTFATIASWSSTLAPLLIMAVMSLVSFPVAKNLKDQSAAGSSNLPTSFQFSLLLESLTGSITSVWTLLKYRRWPHKQPLASLLRTAFTCLILASIVGYTVAGIDTWLHLVMDTVEVDLVSSQQHGQHEYGRAIDESLCANLGAPDFDADGCIVNLAVTGSFLIGGNAAFKTLGNLSSTDRVRRAAAQDLQLAYLGPADVSAHLDFQATTLAVNTQCSPISAKCDLHVEDGASEPFHCSKGFYGDLPSRTINGKTTNDYSGLTMLTQNAGVAFYRDQSLSRPGNESFSTHTQNPYYMGVWAYPLGIIMTPSLEKDLNIVRPLHGGITWLLGCNITAYEMTYSWINGSATIDILTKANGTIGTIINSPTYYGFGKTTLESNAYAASAEENSEDLADSFAYLYSRMAMALSSGLMKGTPTVLEQVRQTALVARVPKVPLYTLIAFNLIYGVLGIVLAFMAILARPSEINDVRERLSIAGIVASGFEGARAKRPVESKKEMFAEHSGESSAKVVIERSAYDGWEYNLRQDMQKQVP